MCERVARLLRLTTDLQEDRILGEKNVVVTEEGTWLPAQAASALQDKHAREVMPTTAERDAATKDLFVSGSLLRAPINWGDQAIGNDGSVELPEWFSRPS